MTSEFADPTSETVSWRVKVFHRLSRIFQEPVYLAILEAVISGIVASLILDILNGTQNRYETVATLIPKIWFPTMSAYLLVAVALKSLWKSSAFLIPSWLAVPVLGSILALLPRGIPGAINGWLDPYQQEPLLVYVVRWVAAAATIWTGLNLVLLPITACVHYSRRILRNMFN